MTRISSSLKYLFLLIALTLFIFYSFAQSDKKYDKELKIFMRFARDSIFKNKDTLFATGFFENSLLFHGCVFCLRRSFDTGEVRKLPADTTFTDSEIAYIFKQAHDNKLFKIPSGILKRSQISIRPDSLDKLDEQFKIVYEAINKYKLNDFFELDTLYRHYTEDEKKDCQNLSEQFRAILTKMEIAHHGLTRFSKPIFVRNFQYCIFGNSGDVTALYKKENHQWHFVKNLSVVQTY